MAIRELTTEKAQERTPLGPVGLSLSEAVQETGWPLGSTRSLTLLLDVQG